MSRQQTSISARPEECARPLVRAGWATLALFFGVFGLWAAVAPLNGAVVAEGVVKVEGNRKRVDHLDGGIIRALNIREGDTVAAGDVLITLDDTDARAELEILRRQRAADEAQIARLEAELAGVDGFPEPQVPSLAPEVRDAFARERREFDAARSAIAGRKRLVAERIAELEAVIRSEEAKQKAVGRELSSVTGERETLRPLAQKGLVARPRILGLERTASSLEASLAEIAGSLAQAKQSIAAEQQKIRQIDRDENARAATELRTASTRLAELLPRIANAEAVLARKTLRAPASGRIVGLKVSTVGGVIGRGEPLMDIVPMSDALVVEASVKVEEISDVHPDTPADVHLLAFKQRSIPVVRGTLERISADRLVNERSSTPYYEVLVRIDAGELARLPRVHLYPGMPVTVTIPTVERTALAYLVGPLLMSFNEAFRQK